jgi:hypothetical protein
LYRKFQEVITVKRLLIVLILTLAMSALVFGFGIELGAGVNMMSAFGISIAIPTVAAGVNIPITGPFSITGQFDTLFSTGSTSSSNSSMAFMILGGGRYTFNMSSMKAFVGADGGVLTSFSGSSSMIPVFGVNAGAIFNMFYIKGAMRWLSVTSSAELDHPVTVFLTLTEITGGLYFEF